MRKAYFTGAERLSWCLTLAVFLSASCSKKSSGGDGTNSSDTGTISADGGTPGISANSGNNLVVAGQLALTGLSLADAPKGVLAFKSRQGSVNGTPEVIDVDAEGKFKVNVVRTEDAVATLVAEAGKAPADRNWDAMLQAARNFMGGEASDLTVERLKAMSESEIQSGVGELAAKAKKSGPVTLLVAYDKTGDKVTEAQSFRFISLPTPENRPLSAIPTERLKGDVSLGKISGSKRDVTSEASSSDALDLSPGALESLADVGRSLKNIVNSYMNDKWTAEPFYFWKSSDHYTDALDKFSEPANSSYKGYGFYVKSSGDQGLTYENLCGTKSVVFTPPAPVTLVDDSNQTSTAASFGNAGATPGTQNNNRICTSNSYYAREDVYGGRTSYMLNFGTGGSITTSPQGLWKLTVDNVEVGRYDFDLASPIVDGKPVTLIPRAKFITSNGQVTGVEVELYRWNGTGYVKVEDLGGFSRLVSDINASITQTSPNADINTTLKIGDDNRITGAFDGNEKDDQGVAQNPSVATSNITAFAVYYVIGNASYRTEFR